MKRSIAIVIALLTAAGAYAADGDIQFKPPNIDPVFFSHDLHTKGRGVRCGACHFRLFERVGGSYQMKREKLTKMDFCMYCHNGMKAFDAQNTKNCARCHKRK